MLEHAILVAMSSTNIAGLGRQPPNQPIQRTVQQRRFAPLLPGR
jgi:hypothetical protein